MSLSAAMERERREILRNVNNSRDAWSSTDEEIREKRKKKRSASSGMPSHIEALLKGGAPEAAAPAHHNSIAAPEGGAEGISSELPKTTPTGAAARAPRRRRSEDNETSDDEVPQSAGPRIQISTSSNSTMKRQSSDESRRPKSAMAAVFGDAQLPNPGPPRKGRAESPVSSNARKSRSPSTRLWGRSSSPLAKALNMRSIAGFGPKQDSSESLSAPAPDPMSRRRFSEGVVRIPTSPLATTAPRKASDPTRKLVSALKSSDGAASPPQLKVDNEDDEDEDEAVDSDEDSDRDVSPDSRRGRRRSRRTSNQAGTSDNGEPSPLPSPALQRKKSDGDSGEDDPGNIGDVLRHLKLTVTSPDGTKSKSGSVHPLTSFDQGGESQAPSPMNSDEEADLRDIKRAQRMALTISQIHSTPEAHRVIRQIIRGDYAGLARDAQRGERRQRVYLVATDLSEEAAYAMEWTIGTVLRDGDTLLAVYAVDEEVGTGENASGVGIGEGASAVRDTAKISETLSQGQLTARSASHIRTSSTARASSMARTASTGPASRVAGGNRMGRTESPNPKGMSKAERERYQAAQMITDRCVKLLRKTRLQVRVIVEVFHCKSPKHMITEVIDYLDPTLVVLGSRGRSALKGVLLGSFSNYLVTKSSVPVMVARRRLRKHHKRAPIRLANMLTNPHQQSASRFKYAKVDEMMDPEFQKKKQKEEKELKEALALIPR